VRREWSAVTRRRAEIFPVGACDLEGISPREAPLRAKMP